ncbi:MAG: NAD-dependent protein deacylase [Lachnospiraceae bacterium]|nr:NAD-dependent protein deacylase [Lachnospiraceae bacterium]
MSEIEKLQQMIDESSRIVFFGGAGVSTESGVPDFRSVDGLYNQKWKYPPETILSHSFYMHHKDEFYEYYFDKIMVDGIGPEAKGPSEIQPNAAHKKLAELEEAGKLTAVVTQNIDGLHQKAGSKKVYELHGSIMRNYCERCGKFFDGAYILAHKEDKVPKCDDCGGDIKPDVVLYEEGLDQDTIAGAVKAISEADMLIIGGTSLAVYPAAGLIDYFSGKYLVLINKSATQRDAHADLVITESIGKVFEQIRV